jgi:secretion/DNA translocation related TadE-like protein
VTGHGSPPRRCAGDAGSGSVLVLGIATVLVAVGILQASLAAVAVVRHRAAGVADLAALAAAEQVGSGRPCAAAAVVADVGGATLVHCAVDGAQVQVVVEVRPPGPLGELGAARSRARAGPSLGRGPLTRGH